MRKEKDRRRLVAALLTFPTPGLGHLYSGEFRRAIAIFTGWIGLAAILLYTPLQETFRGLGTFIIVLLAVFLMIMISSVRAARRNSPLELHAFNKWYLYALVVLFTHYLVVPSLIAFSPFKSYYIPSGSMEPAILIGDHIYTRRFSDQEVHLRRGQIVIALRGDVGGSNTFVRRIVGLPGETVSIVDKKVFVDGKPLKDPWGVHRDTRVYPAKKYLDRKARLRDNRDPMPIPENSVLLLGDNRDSSYDDRYLGPTRISDLIGEALYVYWSQAGSGLDSIRFQRIGHDLHGT